MNLLFETERPNILNFNPFHHLGVDYAGQYLLNARRARCKVIEIFFTGIRGVCTRLWSDNATNFQGAEKALKKMKNENEMKGT